MVGSKHMCRFKPPNLSFPSTRTKLFIHGSVSSCNGFSIPALSIFLISCLKLSLRWTGTGQQGVCLGGMLGSSWILYGGPGILLMPSKTSGYCDRICSLLVISLLTSWFFAIIATGVWVATCCVDFWATAFCLDLWTDNLTDLVFFGWSKELVIKLVLGGG